MKRMDLYIARTVIVNVLLVLLVLTVLAAIMNFVSEIHTTYNHPHYTLWEAALYTLMQVPAGMYDMFTVAVLLGALLGLGELAAHNELTVFRVAGVSAARIGLAAICGGVLLAAACVLLGEFVVPNTEQTAEDRRAELVDERSNPFGAGGVWARDGMSFVNVRAVANRETARGVYVYNVGPDRQLKRVDAATLGKFKDGRAHLVHVRGTTFEPDAAGSDVRTKRQQVWKTSLTPELISLFAVDADTLSAHGLYSYIDYLQANRLDDSRYRAAFWARIAKPVALLAMLLLALPFVFGPLRSSSTGQRMLTGMLLGIGFYVSNSIFMQTGIVFGLNPVFTAWLPTVLLAGISLFAVQRIR